MSQHASKYDAFLGYSTQTSVLTRATDMPNDKSLNDAMANLAMHDLKSMNAIDSNATDHFVDRMKSVQTERAIVKSNDFVRQPQQQQQQHHHQQNQSVFSKMAASNQWMASTSPDPLIKPFNYKADSNNASKEILWASTQSSPNSTQRDQMRSQFKKSTSTPSNLWESPTLKLSPQSTLMIRNNNDSSSSSVWYTPPQIQSPAMSSGQSIWDSPTSSILNHSIESFGSADCSASLLRPQDLSPNDGWYNSGNATKLQSANTFNTFKADSSVWSNAPSSTVGNKMEGNIFTSTPYKSSSSSSSGHDGQKDASKKISTPKSTSTAIVNSDTNPASSSCLQLFSDDFINYLNMIN